MIDRYYILTGAIAAGVLWPGVDAMLGLVGFGVIGLLIFVFVILLPLMLREGVAYSFGGARRAPFIKLRWLQGKRSRAAQRDRAAAARRLIDGYGLDLRGAMAGPPEALRRLVTDALEADAALPATLSRPLRVDLMGQALAEASGAGQAEGRALGTVLTGLIPMNRPVPPRRRVRAALCRLLSPLVIPLATVADLSGQVAAELPQRLMRRSQPRPAPETVTPARLAADMVLQTREIAALPALPTSDAGLIRDLPLSDQITLRIFACILAGTPPRRLIWRHPSRHRQIRLLVDLAARARFGQAAAPPAAPAPEQTAPEPAAPVDIPALLVDHAQPAILLRRVWPMALSDARSHLGGLPLLPPGMGWPRRANGQPLHFLARIDCAEMLAVDGPAALPPDGTLLFFADISEEMIFENDSTAVLYLPAGLPAAPQALPDDLPPLHHGDMPLPGPRGYDPWPITPRAVQTWDLNPGSRAPAQDRAWRAAARAAQIDSLAAHVHRHEPGRSFGRTEMTLTRPEPDGARVTVIHPDLVAAGWPWCGAVLSRFLDDLRLDAERLMATPHAAAQHEAARKVLANIAKAVPRFAALGPADPVPPELAQALYRWINGGLRAGLPGLVAQAMRGASLATLRRLVQDDSLRRVLPAGALHLFAADLRQDTNRGQHLMLGAPQHKTNETGPGGGAMVRLLCLDSDPALGFAFCDGGVIEYWIAPQALAARDFSAVTARTAGG